MILGLCELLPSTGCAVADWHQNCNCFECATSSFEQTVRMSDGCMRPAVPGDEPGLLRTTPLQRREHSSALPAQLLHELNAIESVLDTEGVGSVEDLQRLWSNLPACG